MIRQSRESLLSIIPAKDSADITSNPSIITIYQTARIQLSHAVRRDERERYRYSRKNEREKVKGMRKKRGDRATGERMEIDKYRVTHYTGHCWT